MVRVALAVKKKKKKNVGHYISFETTGLTVF